jgi:DNA (cytosine-5)-methyltransferase 1
MPGGAYPAPAGAAAMNAIHLCCGAGGITLGFEWAGIRTAFAFDINPVAVETHRMNFTAAPCEVRDIRSVHPSDLPPADVWTCGIPCEPFSMAGQRLGEDDGRDVSADLSRLIREARANGNAPRFFFLENVPPYGKTVSAAFIRSALDGYHAVEAVFRHADYGVPQMRERWHLIASRFTPAPIPEPTHSEQPNLFGARPWITFGDVREPHPAEPHYMSARALKGIIRRQRSKALMAEERGTSAYAALFVVEDGDLVPTILSSWGKGISRSQTTVVFDDYRFRGPTFRECCRIQGFPDDFNFCGNRRERYEQVGRAVPPPFAEAVARAILESAR